MCVANGAVLGSLVYFHWNIFLLKNYCLFEHIYSFCSITAWEELGLPWNPAFLLEVDVLGCFSVWNKWSLVAQAAPGEHSSGPLSPFTPRDVGDAPGQTSLFFVCCLISIFWMFNRKYFGMLLTHTTECLGQLVAVGMGGAESSPDLAEKAVWRWAKAEGGHQLQTSPFKRAQVRRRGKLLCQRLTAQTHTYPSQLEIKLTRIHTGPPGSLSPGWGEDSWSSSDLKTLRFFPISSGGQTCGVDAGDKVMLLVFACAARDL